MEIPDMYSSFTERFEYHLYEKRLPVPPRGSAEYWQQYRQWVTELYGTSSDKEKLRK